MTLKQKTNKCETATIPLGHGEAVRLLNPESYLAENPRELQEVIKAVRAAFGTHMTDEDIRNHLINPQQAYLLRNGQGVFGMGAYTSKNIKGQRVLYIEGVAVCPSVQGKRLFEELTTKVLDGESFLSIRTQNPRMYAAFAHLCDSVYPNPSMKHPSELLEIFTGMAEALNMNVDEEGVARGFYGKALYPKEPYHRTASILFNEVLGVNLNRGDSVLCVGRRKNGR